MASTIELRVRVPASRLRKVEKILKHHGLTLDEAVNLFLAKVEEVGGIPFDLHANHSCSAKSNAIKIEDVPVDKDTQKKMDLIGTAWKRVRK